MTPLLVAAAFFTVLAASLPARTEPRPEAVWTPVAQQSLQSARVHSLVATSFHAVHASF